MSGIQRRRENLLLAGPADNGIIASRSSFRVALLNAKCHWEVVGDVCLGPMSVGLADHAHE